MAMLTDLAIQALEKLGRYLKTHPRMVFSLPFQTARSTRASLALSRGEAEYYGVVRAAGIGLGQQALFRDAG